MTMPRIRTTAELDPFAHLKPGEAIMIGSQIVAPASDGSGLLLPAHIARSEAERAQLRQATTAVRTLFEAGRQAQERIRRAELNARPHRSRGARKRIARGAR